MLTHFAASWAKQAFGLLAPLVGHTGSISSLPQVKALWHISFLTASMFLLLLLVLQGGRVMAGEALGSPLPLPSALFRTVASFGLMWTSLRLGQEVININDLLIQSIGVSAVARGLRHPSFGSLSIDALVLWLPYIALSLILALVYMLRLAELMFLLVVAPWALAMGVLPATQRLAGQWLTEFFAVTFTQFLQALVLLLARGAQGFLFSHSASQVLYSLAILYLLIRMPGYVRSLARSSAMSLGGHPIWIHRL